MKRFLAILMAVTLVLTSGIALAERDGAQLRFSWWGGDERHEATLNTLKLYEASHPGSRWSASTAALTVTSKSWSHSWRAAPRPTSSRSTMPTWRRFGAFRITS